MAEAIYKPSRLILREFLANKHMDWYSGDSEENFRENFDQISHYFQTAKIDYTWNSDGYRTKHEFDDLEDGNFALCFGCSYTEGVGVGEEDTWPAQVQKLIGVPCVNMGISGGGSDVITANTRLWMNNRYPKPHFVFIQIPEVSREPRVYIDPERTPDQFPGSVMINPSWDMDSFHWDRDKVRTMADKKNLISRYWVTSNNLSLASAAWRAWGVPVLFFTYDMDGDIFMHHEDVMRVLSDFMHDKDGNVDYARDLAHNGRITNTNIASALVARYDEVEQWRANPGMESQPYTKNPHWKDYPESWKALQDNLDYKEIKGRRPFIYE